MYRTYGHDFDAFLVQQVYRQNVVTSTIYLSQTLGQRRNFEIRSPHCRTGTQCKQYIQSPKSKGDKKHIRIKFCSLFSPKKKIKQQAYRAFCLAVGKDDVLSLWPALTENLQRTEGCLLAKALASGTIQLNIHTTVKLI